MRILPLLILLAACGGASSTVQCSTADGGTELTYASFGQQFLSSYCTACHGAARKEEGIDLSTLSNVKTFRASVISEAGTRSVMPPAGEPAPTSAERAQLTEWLSCGAN